MYHCNLQKRAFVRHKFERSGFQLGEKKQKRRARLCLFTMAEPAPEPRSLTACPVLLGARSWTPKCRRINQPLDSPLGKQPGKLGSG